MQKGRKPISPKLGWYVPYDEINITDRLGQILQWKNIIIKDKPGRHGGHIPFYTGLSSDISFYNHTETVGQMSIYGVLMKSLNQSFSCLCSFNKSLMKLRLLW